MYCMFHQKVLVILFKAGPQKKILKEEEKTVIDVVQNSQKRSSATWRFLRGALYGRSQKPRAAGHAFSFLPIIHSCVL